MKTKRMNAVLKGWRERRTKLLLEVRRGNPKSLAVQRFRGRAEAFATCIADIRASIVLKTIIAGVLLILTGCGRPGDNNTIISTSATRSIYRCTELLPGSPAFAEWVTYEVTTWSTGYIDTYCSLSVSGTQYSAGNRWNPADGSDFTNKTCNLRYGSRNLKLHLQSGTANFQGVMAPIGFALDNTANGNLVYPTSDCSTIN